MKHTKTWTVRLAAVLLAGTCTAGAVLAAGSGGESDPLVTLSYLTQTALPQALEQVDQAAAQRQEALQKELDQTAETYRKQVEELVDSAAGDSATYQVVSLTTGQTMYLEVGCEVMLRIGTATVSARTSPALVDISGGGSLENGGSLTTNHLYLATIADRTIQPTAATVRLLVRGGYTIS